MIRLEDRQELARGIDEARAAGARLRPACEIVGIDVRTYQRWKGGEGLVAGDRRPSAARPTPAHALSAEERAEVVRVANDPEFAEAPPARIVPMLADRGRYVASVSTFQRVLRAEGQMVHRGRAKAPQKSRPPTTHRAEGPNEVWCWDMTYLPAQVQGQWFFLYLIRDLYSRKIVGWEVHDRDSSEHAAEVLRRTALTEGIMGAVQKPVLHGDNGATLKATSVLAMLHWLKIEPSYSRPRVSNDNAYAESVFRTAKYRPEYPTQGFASLEETRAWAADFVGWYNTVHRHSGIGYVTPEQRHTGADRAILEQRHHLFLEARARNPRRWTGKTRDWSHQGCVTLNPEREPSAAEDAPTGETEPNCAA
jgi:putative transposase